MPEDFSIALASDVTVGILLYKLSSNKLFVSGFISDKRFSIESVSSNSILEDI